MRAAKWRLPFEFTYRVVKPAPPKGIENPREISPKGILPTEFAESWRLVLAIPVISHHRKDTSCAGL